MQIISRQARNRILQRVLWSYLGIKFLQLTCSLIRRFEGVALNKSLDSETNGEAWLPSILPESPTVVDVGYFEGDYARLVLKERNSATIFSFDPSKSAERHYRQNPNSRITFIHAALDREEGTSVFNDYHNMCGSLSMRDDAGQVKETYKVPVYTLDSWVSRGTIKSIDLLKIDAEGYDLNVLEGATQLLFQQKIDLIQFEYANGWIANRRFLKDAFDFMRDKPYRLFRLFNGFLAPFSYTTIEERFDLGFMVVGVSQNYLSQSTIPIKTIY
jgi:FkbM family methyltransferase